MYILPALIVMVATPDFLPAQSAAAYYPLAVGNSWTFAAWSTQYTERIIDTRTDNDGYIWYLFDSFRHADSVLVRMDDQNNLLLKKGQTETLWLKFGANVSDTWSATFPGSETWTVTLESKTDTLTVPYGSFSNVYRFYFHWKGLDNDLEVYFARDVGPVRRVLYGIGVMTDNLTNFNGVTPVDELPAAGNAACTLGSPYPNPATGEVTVPLRVDAHAIEGLYAVYDFLGRAVLEPQKFSLPNGGHNLRFRLGGLPEGIYMLTVISDHHPQSRMISVFR
jgi:hypothetical protein